MPASDNQIKKLKKGKPATCPPSPSRARRAHRKSVRHPPPARPSTHRRPSRSRICLGDVGMGRIHASLAAWRGLRPVSAPPLGLRGARPALIWPEAAGRRRSRRPSHVGDRVRGGRPAAMHGRGRVGRPRHVGGDWEGRREMKP